MDDKRLTIERWMIKAGRDLETAQTMLGTKNPPTDVVCFHCQQAAEKSLKAFLVLHDHDFQKTHDLPYLLTLCSRYASELLSAEEDARFLTAYAVVARYVDDWREIPIDEASDALRRAQRLLGDVRARLFSREEDA